MLLLSAVTSPTTSGGFVLIGWMNLSLQLLFLVASAQTDCICCDQCKMAAPGFLPSVTRLCSSLSQYYNPKPVKLEPGCFMRCCLFNLLLSLSVSSPDQGLDSSVCLAVLPATTRKSASCTVAMTSPALQLKTLDRRWTTSQKQSPPPAAAAVLGYWRLNQRTALLPQETNLVEKMMGKKKQKTCWREWLMIADLLRLFPPPLVHTSPLSPCCPAVKLWSPPSTCRCCLRKTPAMPSASSNNTR